MTQHALLGVPGASRWAVIVLTLLALTGATASDTTTATVGAVVQSSLTLTHIIHANQGNLVFGVIAPRQTPGWVQVDPSERRPFRLDYWNVVMVDRKRISDAHFRVRGDAYREYQIILPTSTTVNTFANSMVVDNFQVCPESLGRNHGGWNFGTVGRLGRHGEDFLHVGATLHVGGNQPGGVYEGEFTVTVAYQ